MTYYRCAMYEVETKFKVLNEQLSLLHERNPIESIKTRLKSVNSIKEKLDRKNLPANISSVENNMYDVAGIRVICGFIDDIYMLADCLLKQDDITLIEKKDYIKNPKPNGYRSLHLIVEIPIFLCDDKKYVKDARPCAMCKRVIINSGIEKIYIRNTKTKYTVINVSEFVENDESLEGVLGY